MVLTEGINQHEEVVRARHDDPYFSSRVRRLNQPSVVTDATNREVGAGTQVPARLSAVWTKTLSVKYVVLTAGTNWHEEVARARHDDPLFLIARKASQSPFRRHRRNKS